ncbi:MAG TPA: hypothetical protein VL947_06500 [Cytophagales bacterium]|nr:hypothetical protein [Cytophagales bacterium]
MNSEAKDIELIERYLNDGLVEDEKAAIVQRIAQDPSFAQRVAQQRSAHALIIDMGLLQLKHKMQTGNYTEASKGGFKAYTITGIVLLLSGLGIYLLSTTHTEPALHTKDPVQKDTPKITATPQASHEALITPEKKTKLKSVPSTPSGPVLMPSATSYEGTISPISDTTFHSPSNVSPQTTKAAPIPPIPSTTPQIVIKEGKTDQPISTALPQDASDHEAEEYLFNPSLGQPWTIPLDDEPNASLLIMEKTGTPIYTVQIFDGQPSTWDGRSSTGAEVFMGSYPFIITYKSGKVRQGYITIQR